MIPHRLAVIDLGSNTFHLLIVNIHPDGTWTQVMKDRRYVKLASAGLESISPESIARALPVMHDFGEKIKAFGVTAVRAIGTAALRSAKNGQEVVQAMYEVSGITVEVVDGLHEAGLIYHGITSCLPSIDSPGLIMDIGGGSVEFILFEKGKILYRDSYNIGVAVLYQRFHTADPMPADLIAALEKYIDETLQTLYGVLDGSSSFALVGASGSFEVIRDVMPLMAGGANWAQLDIGGLETYLSEIIALPLESRRLRPEIPEERLDYIVVAYILIRRLLQVASPKGLYYSDFALKEGVIEEYIDNF